MIECVGLIVSNAPVRTQRVQPHARSDRVRHFCPTGASRVSCVTNRTRRLRRNLPPVARPAARGGRDAGRRPAARRGNPAARPRLGRGPGARHPARHSGADGLGAGPALDARNPLRRQASAGGSGGAAGSFGQRADRSGDWAGTVDRHSRSRRAGAERRLRHWPCLAPTPPHGGAGGLRQRNLRQLGDRRRRPSDRCRKPRHRQFHRFHRRARRRGRPGAAAAGAASAPLRRAVRGAGRVDRVCRAASAGCHGAGRGGQRADRHAGQVDARADAGTGGAGALAGRRPRGAQLRCCGAAQAAPAGALVHHRLPGDGGVAVAGPATDRDIGPIVRDGGSVDRDLDGGTRAGRGCAHRRPGRRPRGLGGDGVVAADRCHQPGLDPAGRDRLTPATMSSSAAAALLRGRSRWRSAWNARSGTAKRTRCSNPASRPAAATEAEITVAPPPASTAAQTASLEGSSIATWTDGKARPWCSSSASNAARVPEPGSRSTQPVDASSSGAISPR